MTIVAQPVQLCRALAVECHRREAAARVRLVTFAHAGGAAATFHRWAPALAPAVELWPVTLPGRARRWREPCAREWPPLVDEIAGVIASEVPAPFALLGHSLGALVAFEVARRLTAAGSSPAHLIVSGRPAPERPPATRLPSSDDELLAQIDALCGGVPQSVRDCPEVLEHFLPILRADLELARGYALRPGITLTCPITAVGGDADPLAPPLSLHGWGNHTAAGFELCVLAGGHFYLFDDEPAALATIRARLFGG